MSMSNCPVRANKLNLSVCNYIDGAYIDISSGKSMIDKCFPCDESMLCQLGSGTHDDVNRSFDSAQSAVGDGR